jgi:hypothetical protein
MSQKHPLHTFPTYFFKTHSNIIFSHTYRSPDVPLPFRFSDGSFVRISSAPHACYMSRSHLPWFEIWWSVQVAKFFIVRYSPVSCQFFPLTSEYFPQHRVLKHVFCCYLYYLLLLFKDASSTEESIQIRLRNDSGQWIWRNLGGGGAVIPML